MKTFIRSLAALSALAAAGPALAHPTPRALHYAHNFEAIGQRVSPRDGAPREFSVGSTPDSNDTATGGPVGGLNN